VENQNAFQFQWNSALGYSVSLFLLINFIYLLLGILTPILYPGNSMKFTEMFGLVFSPRSDKAAFGKTTLEIVGQNSAIMSTKIAIYQMYFGLYCAIAILHFFIVWFGLKCGHSWALWALTASNFAVIFFFILGARYFSQQLTPLYFKDLPPYATIPGLLLPIATVLGWLGLHS